MMQQQKGGDGKRLIVVVGPTGAGKSALAAQLAVRLGGVAVVSCDSRQFYRQMSIGTAVPTVQEQAMATHYFVHNRSVDDPCDAGTFEREALELIEKLHQQADDVIMVGGSGMYVDAVCRGFDDLPEASAELREQIGAMPAEERLQRLQALDPVYYEQVDRGNNHRVQRALEVCLSSGRPYSEQRTGLVRQRNFEIVKIGVTLPREQLYKRIDDRVDMMMEAGLLAEAEALYDKRHLSSLQTVGYREIFDYMDGRTSLSEAVALIKRNSRRYAKRQMTWFRRDDSIRWFAPDEVERVVAFLQPD